MMIVSDSKVIGKHTPGPWMIGSWYGQCKKPEHGFNHPGLEGDNPCVYEPVFHADGSVCTAGGVNVLEFNEIGEMSVSDADLNLIAAAPDLLEALERMVRHAEKLGRSASIYNDARAAIAKAKGLAQ